MLSSVPTHRELRMAEQSFSDRDGVAWTAHEVQRTAANAGMSGRDWNSADCCFSQPPRSDGSGLLLSHGIHYRTPSSPVFARKRC